MVESQTPSGAHNPEVGVRGLRSRGAARESLPRYQNEAPGVVRTSGASNQVDREGGKMELQAYFSILGGFIRLEDDEF
jgi:hypothetical protein